MDSDSSGGPLNKSYNEKSFQIQQLNMTEKKNSRAKIHFISQRIQEHPNKNGKTKHAPYKCNTLHTGQITCSDFIVRCNIALGTWIQWCVCLCVCVYGDCCCCCCCCCITVVFMCACVFPFWNDSVKYIRNYIMPQKSIAFWFFFCPLRC